MNEKDIKHILFLDSGIGGISYLTFFRSMYPGIHFTYIADRINFPYGLQDPQILNCKLKYLLDYVSSLFQPQAIVLACNTAYLVLKNNLPSDKNIPIYHILWTEELWRRHYSIYQRLFFLSTLTSSQKLKKSSLAKSIYGESYFYGDHELVQYCENHFFDFSFYEFKKKLSLIVPFLEEFQAQAIVLACTHYLHFEKEFNLCFPSYPILSSRSFALSHLKIAPYVQEGKVNLYLHYPSSMGDSVEERYQRISQYFSFDYQGLIPC